MKWMIDDGPFGLLARWQPSQHQRTNTTHVPRCTEPWRPPRLVHHAPQAQAVTFDVCVAWSRPPGSVPDARSEKGCGTSVSARPAPCAMWRFSPE